MALAENDVILAACRARSLRASRHAGSKMVHRVDALWAHHASE